jgi:hypothetical protein
MGYPDEEIAFLFCCFQDDDPLRRLQIDAHAFNSHLNHVYHSLCVAGTFKEPLTLVLYTFPGSCANSRSLADQPGYPGAFFVCKAAGFPDQACRVLRTKAEKLIRKDVEFLFSPLAYLIGSIAHRGLKM